MSKAWIGVIAAIAIAVLVIYPLAWAEGAPGQPTATISAPINAAQSQTLTLTFWMQVHSSLTPNSIWGLGEAFLYSITQTNAQGGVTVIAQNARVAAAVFNGSGGNFYLTASIQVTTAALCAQPGCAGAPDNLTLTLQGQTQTPVVVWNSPVAHIVFSTIPSYQSIPKIGAADSNSFNLVFWTPIFAAFAVGGVAAYIMKPHHFFAFVGVAGTVLTVLSLLLF